MSERKERIMKRCYATEKKRKTKKKAVVPYHTIPSESLLALRTEISCSTAIPDCSEETEVDSFLKLFFLFLSSFSVKGRDSE
jgi:hypothetical protein